MYLEMTAVGETPDFRGEPYGNGNYRAVLAMESLLGIMIVITC